MPALTRLESELRIRARELIHTGQLPNRAPARLWAGPGSGLPCTLCGGDIPKAESEYETETRTGDAVQLLRFHFVCHAAWQLECARASAGDNVATAPARGMPCAKG
jgi:hypothetical protein